MKLYDPRSWNLGVFVVLFAGCAILWTMNKPPEKLSPEKQRQIELVTDAQMNQNPAMLAPSGTFIPPTPEEKAAMKKKEEAKKAEMKEIEAKIASGEYREIPVKLISGKMPLVVNVNKPPNFGGGEASAVYDLGNTYNVSVYQITNNYTMTVPTPSIVSWELYLSKDNIKYDLVARGGVGDSTGSDTVFSGRIPKTSARYVRWKGSIAVSPPGSYVFTLKNSHVCTM